MIQPLIRFAQRTALAVTLVAACAATSNALPIGRYSWDACDPVVGNENWAGPGTYVQVISVVGLVPGTQAVRFTINTGAAGDAWRFGDFSCQPASRLTFSAAGGGCAPGPVTSYVYQQQIWLTQPDKSGFDLTMTLDPAFVPDPSVRYALAVLSFDHSHSQLGNATVPGNCGYVDFPVCFAVAGASYVVGGVIQGLPLDSDYLTWQNFNATSFRPCPLATASVPVTWGRIRSQYR